MNHDPKAILDLSKESTLEYVTASRCLTSHPCYVLQVIVDPTNAAAVTQNYLRNGETSTSDILLGLASQFTHTTHIGHFPLYFNKGLYVEKGANTDGITVQYLLD